MVSYTIFFALLLPTAAQAGRPLSTEDASTLDDGRCQVEAWIDRSNTTSTGWFVPACNAGAGIEWQVGFARTHEGGSHRFTDGYAQAKKVLKPIAGDSPWGLGLVAGVNRHATYELRKGWEHPYFVIPLSIAIGEAVIHLNAGWSRDREQRRDVALWGIAFEKPVATNLTFVTEAYGENATKPFLRLGGRISIVKDVLDADLTWVTRSGGERNERFVSLGLFWQSDRFLKMRPGRTP